MNALQLKFQFTIAEEINGEQQFLDALLEHYQSLSIENQHTPNKNTIQIIFMLEGDYSFNKG